MEYTRTDALTDAIGRGRTSIGVRDLNSLERGHGRPDRDAGRVLDVLLVEDNPGDARLVELAVAEINERPGRHIGVRLCHVARLADALARLGTEPCDAILLDLQLPDSLGLATFEAIQSRAPDRPIIVLSGNGDEAVADQAVRAGAQDYLLKGRFDGELLVRSIRFAVERRRAEAEHQAALRAEVERAEAERALRLAQQAEAARRERQEREIRSLERLSDPLPTTVTARTFGIESLRQALPGRFEAFVQRYIAFLDQAVEERTYRVDNHLSDALRAFVDEIGFLRAGPRDVIDLHTAALRQRIAGTTPQRSQAYIDEARIIVLRVMGYLAAYYRNG